MTDLLLILATIGWLLLGSLLYGVIVGKDVQDKAKEATGFAVCSGMLSCIVVMLVGAL